MSLSDSEWIDLEKEEIAFDNFDDEFEDDDYDWYPMENEFELMELERYWRE